MRNGCDAPSVYPVSKGRARLAPLRQHTRMQDTPSPAWAQACRKACAGALAIAGLLPTCCASSRMNHRLWLEGASSRGVGWLVERRENDIAATLKVNDGPNPPIGKQAMRASVCAALAFATCVLVLMPGQSLAQAGLPDARRGREVAARLCTNCHAMDRQTSTPARADVPSFPTIASRPGVTSDYLAGKMILPHPAMPGIPLTTAEIRDIVAYIISLRRND